MRPKKDTELCRQKNGGNVRGEPVTLKADEMLN